MAKTKSYRKFKDLHKGETGLLVANGPSLADVPIEFLKSYVTLGCNRITHMTPEFVPTYYACLGMNQVSKEDQRETIYPTIEHPDCKAAFINRLMIHEFPYDNVYSLLGGWAYHLPETAFFSLDPLNITGLHATMTFVLLQIAFYMGFDTILIVGLDHNYPEGTKRHFYDDGEFPDFEQAPGPIYENDSEVWQEHATAVLSLAQEVYIEHGRQVINLTSGSHCEVFRKEALSAWLDKD